MMKNYHLYIFTQPNSQPCQQLLDHFKTLTANEQAELDVVPIMAADGFRTCLAEELSVELTPTLVVTHETVTCEIGQDDEEYCELEEEPVERFVGTSNIVSHLQATLDAYTYAHPE